MPLGPSSLLPFSCLGSNYPSTSSAKRCVLVLPTSMAVSSPCAPVRPWLPKSFCRCGKLCVTSTHRLAFVASLVIGLGVRLSPTWCGELGFHQQPIHSADLFHLQTSNPASTPAHVQGSVRLHTTLDQGDRMLCCASTIADTDCGTLDLRLTHAAALELGDSDVASFVWSMPSNFVFC